MRKIPDFLEEFEIFRTEEYDYVHYLKFVKEEYSISYQDIAKVLGVTRQTVYRYIKEGKTLDLPDTIIDKILEITGTFTTDELAESYAKVIEFTPIDYSFYNQFTDSDENGRPTYSYVLSQVLEENNQKEQ